MKIVFQKIVVSGAIKNHLQKKKVPKHFFFLSTVNILTWYASQSVVYMSRAHELLLLTNNVELVR